ncbi:MAG: FHA domain-containing protein, partial [Acidobacteriota bacterium]
MTQPVFPLTLTWTEPTSGTARRVLVDHAIRFGADSRQNDVCLPFEGVQTLHAEIVSDVSGRWELVALGGHSILVNQAYVSRAPLDAGDAFSIGPVDFAVTLPALTGSHRIADITAGGPPDRSTSGRLTGRPSPAVTVPNSDARPTRLLVIGGLALALAAFGGWSLARIGRQAPAAAAKPTASPVAPTPIAEIAPTPPLALVAVAPPAVQPSPGGTEPFTAVKKAVVTVIARLSFEKGFS